MAIRLELGDIVYDCTEALSSGQPSCLVNDNLSAQLYNDAVGRRHMKNSLKILVESDK